MSKYTIILIVLAVIVVVTGTFLLLMWTGLIFLVSNTITGSYCASIGITKLVDRDLNFIQNNTENPTLFLDLIDGDLKQIPKLREVVSKVASRVEFNKQGYATLSYGETIYSYDFFNDKSLRQYNTKVNEWWFLIDYNDKTYGMSNLMVPESPQEIQISVEQVPYAPRSIKVTDEDLALVPKIKSAIDEIGTYEVSPYDSVGLPEDEQNKIQKWFEKKYKEKYGVDGFTSYFHYNGKSYSTSFSIC